jgi:hypothetical protein
MGKSPFYVIMVQCIMNLFLATAHSFPSQGTHAITGPIFANTHVTVGSEFDAVSTGKHIQVAILFAQRIEHVLMQSELEQLIEQNPIVWDLSRQKVVIHQEGFQSTIAHGWNGCCDRENSIRFIECIGDERLDS